MTQQEHRDNAWARRDGFRKTKAHLEFNLVRCLKGNKKFQKEDGENTVCCLMGQAAWWQETWKRLKYLMIYLPWCLLKLEHSKLTVCGKGSCKEDVDYTYTTPCDTMGCTHECCSSLLTSLQYHSWLSLKHHGKHEKFLKTGRKQTPIFKKGKKEDTGNHRSARLALIPGTLMEQLILVPL